MKTSAGNDPVRIVLLGLNFGQGILRHLQRDVACCRVVGVCDQNQAKAGAIAAEFGLRHYRDLDAALGDGEVEAVALFSGPAGRASLVSRIVLAGRHIITTKPFELDASAAEAALALAAERGCVVHLNSPGPRPAEDIAAIASWRDQYKLGRPVAMEARTWARYTEKPDGSWYDDPARCPLAPMLRLGIYFLNDFVPLLGPASAAYAVQARLFTGRPTADHVQALIRHANGATSSVLASFCIGDGLPYQDEVVLNFENGTIRRRVVRRQLPDMSSDHAELLLQTGAREIRARTAAGGYAGWYQWRAFHQAVRAGAGADPALGRRIVEGIRLFNALARSATIGHPQSIVADCVVAK